MQLIFILVSSLPIFSSFLPTLNIFDCLFIKSILNEKVNKQFKRPQSIINHLKNPDPQRQFTLRLLKKGTTAIDIIVASLALPTAIVKLITQVKDKESSLAVQEKDGAA